MCVLIYQKVAGKKRCIILLQDPLPFHPTHDLSRLTNTFMLEERAAHLTKYLLCKHKNLRLVPRRHIKMSGAVEHVSLPREFRDRSIPTAY